CVAVPIGTVGRASSHELRDARRGTELPLDGLASGQVRRAVDVHHRLQLQRTFRVDGTRRGQLGPRGEPMHEMPSRRVTDRGHASLGRRSSPNCSASFPYGSRLSAGGVARFHRSPGPISWAKTKATPDDTANAIASVMPIFAVLDAARSSVRLLCVMSALTLR